MIPVWWRGLRQASLVLVLAGGMRAQDVHADATLAADPDRLGPPAWTWLRVQALPHLPGYPAGLDPLGPLHLQLAAAGLTVRAAQPSPAAVYLQATITLDGHEITVRGTHDGSELWTAKQLGAPDNRLVDLVQLLALTDGRGPRVFEARALVGALSPGIALDDPHAGLLTTAPAECGEITVKILTRNPLRVVGRSAGGLLLPAVLAVFADAGGAPPGRALQSRPWSATDRWALLARCARDQHREEAARQLALLDEPQAASTLARLLSSDDFARAVAMEALLRRDDLQALRSVVAAATPEVEATEELAVAAMAGWWSKAPPAERRAVLTDLESSDSARLKAFATRWCGSPDVESVSQLVPLRTTLLAALAGCSLLLALGLRRRRLAALRLPTS